MLLAALAEAGAMSATGSTAAIAMANLERWRFLTNPAYDTPPESGTHLPIKRYRAVRGSPRLYSEKGDQNWGDNQARQQRTKLDSLDFQQIQANGHHAEPAGCEQLGPHSVVQKGINTRAT